jgi:sodium ion-translocating decarboxylase beta subunit
MGQLILEFIQSTGFYNLSLAELVMIGIACVLLYLGIVKKYEPLLLVPISFGILLANLPLSGLLQPESPGEIGGLLYYLSRGLELGIYPPLIFLGIGAMTDFGPLIANPVTLLLGAAAQLGIFTTFTGAYFLGFTAPQSGAIGIIGGADGPTAIYVANKLAPELLGSVAIAAYSYMALVPIIQPPIMRLLTTRREREVVMKQLRPVSKTEKIIFPIVVIILTGLLLPAAVPLLGMLMFGNLLRESGVTERLSKTAQTELNNIIVIFLGLSVGAKAKNYARLNSLIK